MQGDVTRANLQALQFDGWYPIGQGWLDVQPLMRGIGPQTQDSTQHMEDAAGGPGLWNVGPTGVEDGKILVSASADKTVRVWTRDSVSNARQSFQFDKKISRVQMHVNGKSVVATDGRSVASVDIESCPGARRSQADTDRD